MLKKKAYGHEHKLLSPLDYLLNKKTVSLWNSCENFPGYFPDLFLPKRRFEESMHLLLSYCPLAQDVVENCD